MKIKLSILPVILTMLTACVLDNSGTKIINKDNEYQQNEFNSYETTLCDFSNLKRIDSIERISVKDIDLFFASIDSSCLYNNIEYAEWTNDIICKLFINHFLDFEEAFNRISSKNKAIILEELRNPISDEYEIGLEQINLLLKTR